MEEKVTEISEKELMKELKKFNWGAGFLGLFWSLSNNCFFVWLKHVSILGSIICFSIYIIYNIFVPFSEYNRSLLPIVWFGGLLICEIIIPYLILAVYCGIKGNLWAWKSGKFSDLAAFRKEQRLWGIIILIIIVFNIVSNLFMILFGQSAAKYQEKHQSSQGYRIARNHCNFLNEELPSIFKKFGGNIEPKRFAKELEQRKTISRAWDRSEHGIIHVGADRFNPEDTHHATGYSRMDLYFVKTPDCNINKMNCYAYIEPESWEHLDYTCKFYFNDNGKVVPSKKTIEFINKK